ncbi:RICIN domain-containing protein [Streptomyces lancefieldiae]|uniref:Ricin B lectin domain-containing protein n=1 Tax=Streptomyces lancefieldiae TaxID=3075520 RepID=A0ABU3B0A0_9ACTN|nr:hypothetical protein [Streptomyces sp. DSM 40712]MDT0615242.1 hypothetical protein [Streptomyces sp. DSM 40712]
MTRPDSGPRSEPAGEPTSPRRRWGRGLVLAAVLVALLLAVGLWGIPAADPDHSSRSARPGTAPAASPTALRAPTDGWVTIRPARGRDLCLTDGRDRGGAYGSAVAVQLPCAGAPVPRTFLEPIGAGLYRIQWHHPQQGKGCLTVMHGGPVDGMLEPRDDCTQATLFRVEPAPGSSADVRFRPAGGGLCLGIADDDTDAGAEAVQEPCTGAADQRFVVRAG